MIILLFFYLLIFIQNVGIWGHFITIHFRKIYQKKKKTHTQNKMTKKPSKSKVTHAAATFILQKSNEVLSMIKAPFKRKGNDTAITTVSSNNNASSKSAPQSNRTSAVNCMSNDDASNSNVYTEIDVCNDLKLLPTKDLITKTKSTSSLDFLTSDILRCLFDESTESLFINNISNDDRLDNENTKTIRYVNESIALHANVVAGAEQSLYDIDSIVKQIADDTDSEAGKSGTTSPKLNAIISNMSKNLWSKLKLMSNDDLVVDDMSIAVSDSNSGVGANSDQLKNIDDKVSLKKRFKFKIRTGLNFFKDFKVRVLVTIDHNENFIRT